jgi:nucleotide-binding universal stress UspA family protein
MYRNIVVAFDGSASSLRALDEAIRFAQGSQAAVHVVFVADGAALSSYPVHLRKEVFADARHMLDDARIRMRDAGVGGETALLETENTTDSVARCLQRYAAQMHADLVVMGTHGRTGLRRLVLGSVAEAFLRHSMCPVLLIRPTH